MTPSWIWFLPLSLIDDTAKELKLDKNILAAMVMAESHGAPCAKAYENDYKWLFFPRENAKKCNITYERELKDQKTSWGTLQVLGATARELGYTGLLNDLCKDEKTAMRFGAMFLKKQLERYGNYHDAVAAYNAGSVIKKGGMYVNKKHVDKVFSFYRELTKIKE